jgi:hypothetical protein
MTLILVRQKKHARDRIERNLVIVGLSMERQMILEDLDVVTSTKDCFIKELLCQLKITVE